MDREELRSILKTWQRRFQREHGHRPSRDDIATHAPVEIKMMYRIYNAGTAQRAKARSKHARAEASSDTQQVAKRARLDEAATSDMPASNQSDEEEVDDESAQDANEAAFDESAAVPDSGDEEGGDEEDNDKEHENDHEDANSAVPAAPLAETDDASAVAVAPIAESPAVPAPAGASFEASAGDAGSDADGANAANESQHVEVIVLSDDGDDTDGDEKMDDVPAPAEDGHDEESPGAEGSEEADAAMPLAQPTVAPESAASTALATNKSAADELLREEHDGDMADDDEFEDDDAADAFFGGLSPNTLQIIDEEQDKAHSVLDDAGRQSASTSTTNSPPPTLPDSEADAGAPASAVSASNAHAIEKSAGAVGLTTQRKPQEHQSQVQPGPKRAVDAEARLARRRASLSRRLSREDRVLSESDSNDEEMSDGEGSARGEDSEDEDDILFYNKFSPPQLAEPAPSPAKLAAASVQVGIAPPMSPVGAASVASSAPMSPESDAGLFDDLKKDFVRVQNPAHSATPAASHVPVRLQQTITSTGGRMTASMPKKAITMRDAGIEIQQKVLSWSVNDVLRGGATVPLAEVPAQFHSYEEYCQIFRPLIVEELREQLAIAVQSITPKTESWTLTVAGMSNDAHYCQVLDMNFQRNCTLLENDIVLVCLPAKQLNSAVFGIVSRLEYGKKMVRIMVNPYAHMGECEPVRKRMEMPDEKLEVVFIDKITTAQRQYEALVPLERSPLLSTVLGTCTAKINKDRNLKELAKIIADTRYLEKTLNPSQVAAIRCAMHTAYPCTFIQGPPGTGKTRTLLGLLGVYFDRLLENEVAKSGPPAVAIGIPTQPVTQRERVPTKREQLLGLRKPLLVTTKPQPIATPVRRPGAKKQAGKVLLCAPSNAAVDELVRRLRKGLPRQDGKMHHLNVIRFGNADKIAHDIIPCMLDSIVEERLNKEGKKGETRGGEKDYEGLLRSVSSDIKTAEHEIMTFESIMNADPSAEIKAKLASASQRRHALLNRQMALRQEQATSRKAANQSRRAFEDRRREIRQAVLDEAHVLCCTLSASALEDIRAINTRTEFVIIDEAAQCSEPDVLVPLQYGCSRLVLVGDPQQLQATVLSMKCAEAGLKRPMFARVQEFMRSYDRLCFLNEQYRMHPDISFFPSRHFYGARLLDNSSVIARPLAPWLASSHGPQGFIKPYVVFDVTGRESSQRGQPSHCNELECDLAVCLFYHLCVANPGVSFFRRVAIISPYRHQQQILQAAFVRHFGNDILKSVRIGTVDGFQGQEEDIVIFSCVRSGGSIGFLKDVRRMNVALTRAKHSLFVLGNVRTLCRNRDWNALVEDARMRGLLLPAPRLSIRDVPIAAREPARVPQNALRRNLDQRRLSSGRSGAGEAPVGSAAPHAASVSPSGTAQHSAPRTAIPIGQSLPGGRNGSARPDGRRPPPKRQNGPRQGRTIPVTTPQAPRPLGAIVRDGASSHKPFRPHLGRGRTGRGPGGFRPRGGHS
eukprot:m.131797 g.131797  ORF g.131797 m.131797 type:complete len:1494 (-) comp9820_c1_seq1:59-4540(-)